MGSFIVFLMMFTILTAGIVIGNWNGTTDISNKEITEATKVCEQFEGIYKINKGTKKVIAFCKDGSQLELKEIK